MLEKILTFDGCNKIYIIYENGTIWDVEKQKFKKFTIHYKGYYKASFYINGKDKKFFVHRLVLQTFNPVEGMEDLQINHIDGNKENNCLSNLEWCTQSENQKHAFAHGLISRKGEKNSQHKLTENQVKEISEFLMMRYPISVIACKYNVSKETISAIKNKRNWKEITKDYEFPKHNKV